MTSDARDLVPTTSTDEPLPIVDALGGPPPGVRPIEEVAPALASIAVTPGPVVVAAEAPERATGAPSDAARRRETVDALRRLREALESTSRSLDAVVVAARDAAPSPVDRRAAT